MRKTQYMTLILTLLAAICGHSATAGDIAIEDAYFRTSGPLAKSGAAFMHIRNHSDQDDRLIWVSSESAKRVELHSHIDAGDGVVLMRQVEGGFVIPAHGMQMLARGGRHIMFMGLTDKVANGDIITVTMGFEHAGEISVDIAVDQARKPDTGAMQMDHGSDG
ncbi:MAG: copper chaperone PCu(A)C [Paracoccaceae bacterium]